jgi:hypothetical protein
VEFKQVLGWHDGAGLGIDGCPVAAAARHGLETSAVPRGTPQASCYPPVPTVKRDEP